MLITVNVVLCIGPFLCFGGGGAVFIVMPAELAGSAGSQRKAELMVEAMIIGSPPDFLTDFGRSCMRLQQE